MTMKKRVIFVLIVAVVFVFAACSSSSQGTDAAKDEKITLDVFAPDASLEPVVTVVHDYASFCPNVDVRITFDTGDMLAAKIEAGYQCDVFLSDNELYLDWLDANSSAQSNPNNNDCLLSESRTDVALQPVVTEDGVESSESVHYSVAIVKASAHVQEAQQFVSYLTGEQSDEAFEMYGFMPL